MFERLLIANRGEIACRVISSARRMGIATIAVHSDADAGARHVALADAAVRLGPASAAESYLNTEAILAAARATGAEAIHPGYGFLSENADFVEAVDAAGLTFVGPPAAAIRAMGLKDAAKRAMAAAGVPVVPGYHGGSDDPEVLAREAERIGYPVLIKARAGGGGKGMRLVERPGEFAAALAGARREAAASFGDPLCLIEKYIATPRHIEIQVFADRHGNAVHLFERDCSLQRRHQKVIEEAPAPGMTPEMRAAMGAAAVEAARAIGYVGAGTVEFIVDGTGRLRPDGFWFMEMNTRLQVEHPVTEAITGLDLVELQLRVAAGAPLGLVQEDLAIDGWAFEARLYAEDAARGFLPATGRLDHLHFPEAAQFDRAPLRIDSGVREGDTISPHYDPMIAKVIAHGPDRASALARLGRALDDCRVAGAVTNLAFLAALTRHPGFAAGAVDTGLIARDLDSLVARADPSPRATALAVLAAAGMLDPPAGDDPWDILRGWRLWGTDRQEVRLTRGEVEVRRQIEIMADGTFRVTGEGEEVTLSVQRRDATGLRVTCDGRQETVHLVARGDGITVFSGGLAHVFTRADPLAGAIDHHASGDVITAPMPGRVARIEVEAGQRVDKGAPLVVLEAMKMEHTLGAPRAGTLAEVTATLGAQVADGAILARLEPEDG